MGEVTLYLNKLIASERNVKNLKRFKEFCLKGKVLNLAATVLYTPSSSDSERVRHAVEAEL